MATTGDTATGAIPLDDAGRKALRVGDRVRWRDGEITHEGVVDTVPCLINGKLRFGVREDNCWHLLDAISEIVSMAHSRGPAATEVPDELAALRAKLAALVAACEPFVQVKIGSAWKDTAPLLIFIDRSDELPTAGDFRALATAVKAAKES